MSAPSVRCSCGHDNWGWRRFCGDCGGALAPACKHCRFVNSPTDRFCGGCSSPLVAARAHTAPGAPKQRAASQAERTIPIDVIGDVVE